MRPKRRGPDGVPTNLGLATLWRVFRAQPPSFWFLCFYLMFEYVRPQVAYPQLDILPWGQAMLGLAVVSFILEGGVLRLSTPAPLLLAVFASLILLSSAAAYDPSYSWSRLHEFYTWPIVYLVITNIVTTQRRLLLFLGAFLAFNFKMSLFATRSWAAIGFVWRDWGVAGAPGWFQNSGEFGIEMCVFFPLSLFVILGLRPQLKPWQFITLLGVPASALVGMIASSSRGAILGGVAVLLWMVLLSKHRIRALLGGAVAFALIVAITPPEQKARLRESGTDYTSTTRLTYWRRGIEMANSHPVLGIGYANWIPYYAAHYDGPVQVCHNIFVQVSSELGYTGLMGFLAMIACTFALNRRTRKLAKRVGERGRFMGSVARGLDGALIGYLVSGSFVTVLYYPYFWINLSFTAAANIIARGPLQQPDPAPRSPALVAQPSLNRATT